MSRVVKLNSKAGQDLNDTPPLQAREEWQWFYEGRYRRGAGVCAGQDSSVKFQKMEIFMSHPP